MVIYFGYDDYSYHKGSTAKLKSRIENEKFGKERPYDVQIMKGAIVKIVN